MKHLIGFIENDDHRALAIHITLGIYLVLITGIIAAGV